MSLPTVLREAIYPTLKDKVILVSGGAGGIGKETARLLAASGAKISLADFSEKPLNDFAEELSKTYSGAQVSTTVVDVRSQASVEKWVNQAVSDFGGSGIDGAANLAGVLPKNTLGTSAGIEHIANDVWEQVIGVNLTGLMYCMRAQLPKFNDHGSMVNAASVAGLRGYAGSAAYGASKFGVVGLTLCAAQDVGKDRGIRVNAVAPGTIRTPMLTDLGMCLGELKDNPVMPGALNRDGMPEEIAALIVWLLSSESSFVTGTTYSIDGGHTT
ncbi:hypothetical protein Micbo1qcDRAFT_221555 [Microdochium bolleyi]|uniref:Uncharacterized protein n=1 Tax=Microdochium bolleyi TaxID=196109 RepID=A0A136ILD4_9PEZI|nr:hypothetical protein Micbo1qcDRAFT_221555 [Microdochium bolleyi]